MAKVSAHGAIIGTVSFTTHAKRYMSDRVVLVNRGFGWKIHGKVKEGVTPQEAFDRQIARQRERLARYPEFAAYRAALHDLTGLCNRWKLHAAVGLMPDDPDGVWSEACDSYGNNVSADVDDCAKLCALYRAAVASATPDSEQGRNAAMTLDALFEQIKGSARKAFDQCGEILPTFLFDTPTGVAALQARWATTAEKREAVRFMTLVAAEAKAENVAVLCEAWMVICPVGSPPPAQAPSESPDRVEVLWMVCQSKDRARGGCFRIERAGQSARLGAFEESEQAMSIFDGIVGGRILS